jgi:hypothetical protein
VNSITKRPDPGCFKLGHSKDQCYLVERARVGVILVLHTFTILGAENFHIKSVDLSSIILSE